MILQVVFMLFVFSHRPKSTPTPTASLSANGVPTEAVDYDRLKQVSRHRSIKSVFLDTDFISAYSL